jgi:hypothetical protein
LPGLAQAQHRRTSPRHADFAAQHWSASPMEPPPRRSPDACLPRPSRHLVIPAAVDSDLPTNSVVIPAKAGIQFLINNLLNRRGWTPAFVGVTKWVNRFRPWYNLAFAPFARATPRGDPWRHDRGRIVS